MASESRGSQLPHAKPLVSLDPDTGKGAPSTSNAPQSNQTPGNIPLPSVTIPTGGGAIRGIGEKFSASPATGTATASIPLPITPGRSGFSPSLTLSYDSGAGNGPYGFGWSLSLPSVGRKTDFGLPKYHDEDESDIYQITGAEDLVPVLERGEGGQWHCQKPRRRLMDGLKYDVYLYRPRIESAFSRIERWVTSGSRNTHWRSISKSNVTTIFGENENSRVYDPKNPSHVFQWLASQTYDDKGNVMVFEYKAENSECVNTEASHEFYRTARNRTVMRYLKRVKYGNRISRLVQRISPNSEWMFELVFDYGDHQSKWPEPQEKRPWSTRSDPFSHSRAGFEVRTYRLCRRVLMFHHFPDELNMGNDTLVASLDIGYFQNGHVKSSSLSTASCASSFTKVSYKRQGNGYLQAAMPPVELEYSEAAIDETNFLRPASLRGIPTGIDESAYQFVDLDGEGAAGILSHQGGSYYYKSNLGNGKFGPPVELPRLPTLHVGNAKSPQLMDLLGDGHMDMVRFDGVTPGFYKRNIEDEIDGWEPWKSFKHIPNISWNDPNTKFVDLTGDGHADILVTNDTIHTMYPSLRENGFGLPSYWHPPMDENNGPRLLLFDRIESLFLADMTGDGLSDLVRICCHEVCYWPNLGYGRFGQKVSMSNPPQLQSQDLFKQSRIRLADIDGSGTTDIIYLNGHETRYYLNQSGNGWTQGIRIPSFPGTSDVTSVQVVDLLAKGTACLVWSSSLASDFGTQVRYVDLMATGKPYLITSARNNVGAETKYTYTSSSQYYLADKACGNPWITRLPMSVHVVERTETFDYISKNRFVTQYKYHHGYYDGIEKEFRGFGMVETLDTEEISSLKSQSSPNGWSGQHTNWDHASSSPPILTKTWFHTGVQLSRARIEDLYRSEYYHGDTTSDIQNSTLPHSIRISNDEFEKHDLTPKEIREAYRALRGSAMHSEVYALDGTEYTRRPYTVDHSSLEVDMIQPRGMHQHAIFQVHSRESVQATHDRQLHWTEDDMVPDPRLSHTMVQKTDMYGNVLKSVTISYGREHLDHDKILEPKHHKAQERTYALFTENSVTNAVDLKDDWLVPLAAEARNYELYNFKCPDDPSRLVSPDGIRSVLKKLATSKFDLPYESFNGPAKDDRRPYQRLLQHSQTLYRKNDLTGPLKLGELESLAFSYIDLQLAITPQQMADVFVADGKMATIEVPDMLETLCGYVNGSDGNWWTRTARTYLSPNPDDNPYEELKYAQSHFFHSCRMESPFSTPIKPINSIVTYDKYNLLVQETCDALGNRNTAGERDQEATKPLIIQGHDYRVMAPWLVMDVNRNMTVVAFDVIGLVAGTAVLGKPEAPEGDSLEGFMPDLSEDKVQEYFDAPLDHLYLLGSATSRIIYDHWAYYETRHEASPQPIWSSTLSRDTHISQLTKDQQSRVTVGFGYTDGFSRITQAKSQAEPSPLLDTSKLANNSDEKARRTDRHQWVGSGWTIYNNKGNPVRQFEPYFSETHQFESDTRVGVSPVILYDPLQRVIATILPDHTWSKVIRGPWRTQIWDGNDLVLASDPRLDPDVGGYFEHLDLEEYLPSWFDQRKDGQLGREAQSAARKVSDHGNTPRTVFSNALGQVFVGFDTIKTLQDECDQPTVEMLVTTVNLDVQGIQHTVEDSMGRLVSTARYNYLGAAMRQSGMDNGRRWVLNDIFGNTVLSWDDRDQRLRLEYDELRRTTSLNLSINKHEETVVAQTIYGESLEWPEAVNGRTMVIEARDQSGVSTTPLYDFKGNLVSTGYQLAEEYRECIDWAQDVSLQDSKYKQCMAYDAKNRRTHTILPDGTKTRYGYNVRGLEESVTSQLKGEAETTAVVVNTLYDARGQRTRIEYANGTRVIYSYDPLTFRLTHLQARGSSGPLLQDLSYTYDPIGNITHIRDDAQQTLFFRNHRVEPSNDYTYDSVYRLVKATGREHLGQAVGHQSSPCAIAPSASDKFHTRLDLPNDSKAMGTYVEYYFYDKVGNIQAVKHRVSDPTHKGWTRKYAYHEPSQLESEKCNNRLSSTTVGSITEKYQYEGEAGIHGLMTAMPHLSSMKWDYKDQLRATSRQIVKDGGTPETTWYIYNSSGQRMRKITERQSAAGETTRVRLKERIYIGNFELYHKYKPDESTIALERETVHLVDSSGKRICLVETRTQGEDPGGPPAQLLRFQLSNHLDSATLELDDQGQIFSYEEYYPYGGTSYQGVRSQLQTPKRYRFTGKERDEENGLYYHGARYYASWLGRWTSCDPAGMVDGSNLYMYSRDNPAVLTDPDGRQSSPAWQEVITEDSSGKYYNLNGTDVMGRETGTFKEVWHDDGGDQAIQFKDDKISVITAEKVMADTKKLDRFDFYYKYKDAMPPNVMDQVIKLIPPAPMVSLIPPEDKTVYIGPYGMGTAEQLADRELADRIINFEPPSATGGVFGLGAMIWSGEEKDVQAAIQFGNNVSKLMEPVFMVAAVGIAAKKQGGGGGGSKASPPASNSPKPPLPQLDTTLPPQEAVSNLAMDVGEYLNNNPQYIQDYLNPVQIKVSGYGFWAQRLTFGNAVETAMAEAAAPTGYLTQTGHVKPFKLGGADLTGVEGTPYKGLKFQVTSWAQLLRGNKVLPGKTIPVAYRQYDPQWK
ncbi:hypothetical protein ACLOAV_004674 [Pseudogymnoascus australis]